MNQYEVSRQDKCWIIYDPDKIVQPDASIFSCDQLEKQRGLIGRASGRGETCFFHYDNLTLALRHYRRGGLVARVMKDRYLGVRLPKTRALREFKLLQQMREMNLPVPVPIAASVQFSGLFYRADIITEFLPNTTTLADLLQSKAIDADTWRSIGATIRQFHDRQVYHSDLNARNILLDTANNIYLIDFDQCDFQSGENWKLMNLQRLQRSLNKFAVNQVDFNFKEADWVLLQEGYAG